MNTKRASWALAIVRVAAAGNLLIHGSSRLVMGHVSGFDEYLTSLGFPPYSAWAITLFEVGASICIIAGRWVSPLAILFCLELLTGIVLVHFREGWFVVGGGTNGMEYSVLLILCFAAQAVAHWKKS